MTSLARGSSEPIVAVPDCVEFATCDVALHPAAPVIFPGDDETREGGHVAVFPSDTGASGGIGRQVEIRCHLPAVAVVARRSSGRSVSDRWGR